MISDEPMLSIVDRLKTWWTTSEPKQKVTTLGGIGALLLLLVGSAMFLTRPHYVTLMDGLSEKDKTAVVDALETAGFHPNIDGSGTVQIVESDKARAQLALSRANVVPGTHHWGADNLKETGPFTSPEVERETLNSIHEGEIASTLEKMDGVAAASVIITTPKQSVFADDKTHPTASVTITEKAPGTLTREDGRTIATYVSHTVDGMTMKDVVVVNNQLDRLWDGGDEEAVPGTKAALDAKVSRFWESKIQAVLDGTCGLGNTRVLVSANVDTAKRHRVEKTANPAERPTSITTQKEKMQGGSKPASGYAGAVSNTNPNEKAPAAQNGGGNGQDYDGAVKKADYDLNTTVTETEDGVGDLKGLAVTVMVNSDKVSDVTGIQSAINGALGGRIQTDANGVALPNQPFTATVTSMKFDPTAANAAKEAADKLASQQRNQQILSLLPIAAILFIALLVAKQVGKISKAILPAAPEPAEIAEMVEEDVPDALPGEEGPDALPAPVMMMSPEEAMETYELERFKENVDVPLESLKMMATERPELVATLIKSMMLGDRAR